MNVAKENINLTDETETAKDVLRHNSRVIMYGMIENCVTIAAAVAVYWFSHSAWSFLILINLNSFKGKD